MTPPNSPTPDQATHRLVLVTGPSGAGRSTALNALEDLGYEVIDNLPLSWVPRLLEGPSFGPPMALGIDTRNREFSSAALVDLIGLLRARANVQTEVTYLDCRSEVLLRRYSETRRRHPLAPAESPVEGINRELDLLAPARALADVLLDTSDFTPHDLRAEITDWFGGRSEGRMAISIHSFSYKRGVPRGADMVFDCRFLRNPYWDANLRALNGQDARVADYVTQDKRFEEFFAKTRDLVELLLPAYIEEGKSHLSIAFGCTGGQHRSVCVTEKLAQALADGGWRVSKRHRELERRAQASAASATGKSV